MNKPDITDEDIRHSMNFDQVLKVAEHKFQQAKIYRKIVQAASSGIALLFIVAGIYYYSKPDQPTEGKQNTTVEVIKSDSTKTVVAPQELLQKSTGKTETKKAATEPVKAKKSHPDIAMEKMVITSTPYINAEPLGGFPALYEFINKELKYPAAALADSIQGVVTVSFVVDEKGNAQTFKILNSLCGTCDKEALRVLNKMPAWKPATLDGKPVKSSMTIPITFAIHSR